MPNVLKTAKSADSWRPSAERRKIQTLDQCFLNKANVGGMLDMYPSIARLEMPRKRDPSKRQAEVEELAASFSPPVKTSVLTALQRTLNPYAARPSSDEKPLPARFPSTTVNKESPDESST